jgi:hypothetical protein
MPYNVKATIKSMMATKILNRVTASSLTEKYAILSQSGYFLWMACKKYSWHNTAG